MYIESWRAVANASLFAAATMMTILACGDDEHHPSSSSGATSSGSGGIGCTADPRATPFASGMQAKSTSGRFVAEIVNATPSPPQRGAGDAGMNSWTMKLTLDGAKPDSSAISVTTFMPDHGHGSPRVPDVTENADGTFSVNGLYLFMAGVWQITFSANGGAEQSMFSICVQ